MIRVVAIDPGGTTGVASWIRPTQAKLPTMVELKDRHHVELFNLLTSSSPDVVVLEKFLWQPRRVAELSPVEYIGVVKFYCASRGVKLVEQLPSQAKVLVSDDKLRSFGWWSVGLQHARDAARHLAYYLITTGQGQFLLDRLKGEREQAR